MPSLSARRPISVLESVAFYREALDDIPGKRILHDLPWVSRNSDYSQVLIESGTYGLSCNHLYK